MEKALLSILITVVSFLAMEGVAWLTHKYIMHGLLWSLHNDHHKKEHPGFFERNDFFFLLFAVPGIICLFWGSQHDFGPVFFVGLGITFYGFAYFFVHDIFIHQRFRMFRDTRSVYLLAIRRAHKAHHKHLGKQDGECFGMLWVPLKYFRDARRTLNA
jgi:beta-carotene 3-hydroxylase